MKTQQVLFLLAVAMSAALASTTEETCSLPKDAGPCRMRRPGYFFFNASSSRCEQFVYGGCGGNDNRFRTLVECHDACQHRMEPADRKLEAHLRSDVCLTPPVNNTDGNRVCFGAFARFTFNAKTWQCEKYMYGGCNGLKNLFYSMEECKSACFHGESFVRPPPMPATFGAAAAAAGTGKERSLVGHPAFRFRIASPGASGSGVADEQPSVSSALSSEGDLCLLPPIMPGPIACLAYREMWTYDSRQARCVKYAYGGCRGTKNLFESKEACEARCPQTDAMLAAWTRPELCSLPPIKGPMACAAFMPRFTFNAEKGKCESYVYGGCGATENVFDTESDCVKTCDLPSVSHPRTVDVCGLPFETGRCKGRVRVYGFNKDMKRCEVFNYGGCGGNDNRFSSAEECVNTCGGSEPSVDPVCTHVKCSQRESALYRAKACLPVTKPGECCPSSWDCTRWQERISRKRECFVADPEHPSGGKYYQVGEPVPEANKGCSAGCRCELNTNKEATIRCAQVDCPFHRVPAGCKKLYGSADGCCPREMECDADRIASLSSCNMDNVTYVAGEKMFPKSDRCKVCLCAEGWTGEANDEFCVSADCFARSGDKLSRGCQPVYRDNVCCPTDWVCPPPEETAKPPMVQVSPRTAEVKCPEGSQPTNAAGATSPTASNLIEIEPLSSKSAVTPSPPNAPRVAITKNEDDCLLPKPASPCTGATEKWYFDLRSRTCKAFHFVAPEKPDGNVFDSQSECSATCAKFVLSKAESDPCAYVEPEPGQGPLIADLCLPQRRYRFNVGTQKCEDFFTRGCVFNRNSFFSVDECEARCQPKKTIESPETDESATADANGKSAACSQPAQPGRCKSRLRRFYYDASSGMCRPFFYGGCQGNDNNFLDAASCISRCVKEGDVARAAQGVTLEVSNACDQDRDAGPCRGNVPNYYFDKATSTCRVFFYGGCRGNANRFSSEAECAAKCPVDAEKQKTVRAACKLPVEAGNCKASIKRYHFDEATGACKSFTFTGCRGNDNNFETRADCAANCATEQPTASLYPSSNAAATPAQARILATEGETSNIIEDDPCLLPKKTGMCKAYFPRFYFDTVSKTCKKFIYGGCGGNGNNFATQEQCEERCNTHISPSESDASSSSSEPKAKSIVTKSNAAESTSAPTCSTPDNPICSLPVEVGRCRALKPMWFFNPASGACERFFYGGCGGNANKFDTLTACAAACVVPSSDSDSNSDSNSDSAMSDSDRLPFIRAELNRYASAAVTLPGREPRCTMGSRQFNLGDVVRFNEDACRVCTCTTPPDLSCVQKACPAREFVAPPNAKCTKVMDEDGCCQIGLQCVSANPPFVDPNSSQSNGDACANVACNAVHFEAPVGATCEKEMDANGCCQTGLKCKGQPLASHGLAEDSSDESPEDDD